MERLSASSTHRQESSRFLRRLKQVGGKLLHLLGESSLAPVGFLADGGESSLPLSSLL